METRQLDNLQSVIWSLTSSLNNLQLSFSNTLSLLCYRAKETHQLAEANQEKNQRLREAFGLTDYVDGSAFDPNRKAKEEAAKAAAMATKKYAYVSDCKRKKCVCDIQC